MLALRLVPPMARTPLILLGGGDTKPAASVADLMAAKRKVKDRGCMVVLQAAIIIIMPGVTAGDGVDGPTSYLPKHKRKIIVRQVTLSAESEV